MKEVAERSHGRDLSRGYIDQPGRKWNIGGEGGMTML